MIQQMVLAALSNMGIHGKSPNVSRPWFHDSGASNHMTGSSEYLHTSEYLHNLHPDLLLIYCRLVNWWITIVMLIFLVMVVLCRNKCRGM